MRGHTRKHPTEHANHSTHLEGWEKPLTADDMIRQICGDIPEWAIALRGLRNREGLTQAALGELLGIAQTNISKMELGKRPIGKTTAKHLANLFKTDYRIFL